MRMAICRLTSPVSLLGSRDGVTISPGGQVDLDRVIGEQLEVRGADNAVVTPSRLVTVEEALGEHLLASFELVAAPADVAGASTRMPRERRSADEKE